jgi:hypothetical protein
VVKTRSSEPDERTLTSGSRVISTPPSHFDRDALRESKFSVIDFGSVLVIRTSAAREEQHPFINFYAN